MNSLKNLALALASLVVGFLLCEALVRLTDLDKRVLGDPFGKEPLLLQYLVPDPYMQWRGRPGMPLLFAPGVPHIRHTEFLNSRGLRAPELPRRKRPGVRRVAVLGDSCTFGFLSLSKGVFDTPRPYAGLLQDLADRKLGPDRVEVINYGMIGYTTYHGLRALRREALPDDPDVVVIRFGWNDHLASPAGRSFANPRAPWREALLDLAYRSRLLGLLLYRGIPMDRREGLPWTVSAHPVPWVTEDDYAWNLSRMIDLSRAHGAEPILVDAPPAYLTKEIRGDRNFVAAAGYVSLDQLLAAHERYQAITERVAAEKKVTLIRTADRIGREPIFSSMGDLVHPNQEGHKLIAQRLFLRLFEQSRESARSGAG